MTEQQMKRARAVIAVLLGFAVATSAVQGNVFVPVFAIIAAAVSVFYLQKKVTDVVVDERVRQIRQKASRAALSLFAITAALLSLALFFAAKTRPELYWPGQTLAYAVMFTLLADSAFYYYYNRKG